MKIKLLLALFVSTLFIISSCNSNAAADANNNISANASDQPATSTAVAIPQGMEKIIGEWNLVKVISDKNANHKIDPEEDAKAITNMKDYLKLNANGTCEYTLAKLEGRYEITPKNNRTKLVMYDRTGTETTRGRYIISVTDQELVINRILGGSDFEVFRRQ